MNKSASTELEEVGINDPGCAKVRLKVDLPVRQQRTQNETDKLVNLKPRPYVAHYIPLTKDGRIFAVLVKEG